MFFKAEKVVEDTPTELLYAGLLSNLPQCLVIF